ncbi:MAG: head-tail connector protein [Pseudomonadota bacterium]
MSLSILAPPTAEPVSLDEIKAHLRVTHADEDGLIAGLAVAARQTVEARAGLALMAQRWRLSLDRAPSETVILPLAPVASIDAVSVIGAAGDFETVSVSKYEAATGSPGRVRCAAPWPRPSVALGGVRIDFTAGWADAGAVPDDLKQAIKLLAAQFYETREAAGAERVYRIPGAVDALTAPYRQVRL